jgi:hypothetical protein
MLARLFFNLAFAIRRTCYFDAMPKRDPPGNRIGFEIGFDIGPGRSFIGLPTNKNILIFGHSLPVTVCKGQFI